MSPAYMLEPWYELLRTACAGSSRSALAQQLGVAAPTISLVLNGRGLYGTGAASTARIAERVVHLLGSYACPHLSEQHGTEWVITGAQCRAYAHRAPPTGSPRDLAHWQACRSCMHRPLSAPPPPRVVVARPKKPARASPLAKETKWEPATCSAPTTT